jgi:LmbE family N-acetylglucosaminyl deacetylase
MTTADRLCLLAILAHPDDESFGPGGTLARYAAEGVDVHVCIVTDGAAGSYDPEFLEGYGSIAARRAEELRRAVDVLGATLHTLPYRDSGMQGTPDNEHPQSLVQAPLREVACRLAAIIREIRPQVIITHDPTGGYFHPDHIKVNQAVDLAWDSAASAGACGDATLPPWQPGRLVWTAMPRTWIRWMIRLMRLARKDPRKFGRNADVDLTRLGTADEEIQCRVDIREHMATKLAAGAEHASQGGNNVPWRRIPRWLQRRLFGVESFTLARPREQWRSSDLFDGLR